jgi:hypothetical protein
MPEEEASQWVLATVPTVPRISGLVVNIWTSFHAAVLLQAALSSMIYQTLPAAASAE